MKVFAKYLIAALFPALTLGCASAKYIDEGSDDSIVNVGQINTQDWMIGRIKNNTATHIDTDSLMKKIRVSLNKSGRALTTTAVGLDGPEDASSKAVRELRADDEFNQGTIPSKGNLVSPDYSLSGKIIQNNARAGRIKQSEFAFQLTLTDLKTGLAIWEEEKLIVKQGARAAVGW